MSDSIGRASLLGDAHWTYDDPSGVPEPPLEVTPPGAYRPDVEPAAARAVVTPAQWLLALVSRTLSPKAV